ncbi:hypothetical protein [Varunaivibrio sulfuroxidans]|uniref:Uncharacterized protein n=1 Tax=Varunaivibrio sulfuroxidans TaxID=1773489 RepID=A0A4V2UND9_9PROT|nr:hypothetical protein [Varunaivibrio sulfuroxidans]TCS61701.1 hypothetical protein EDD55_107110 [Varunaivibrio sulfuroxidans]WES32115.1 hypothetical protein P3M64_07085 [Varunaivibrio sulfuroxidans]
MKYIIPLLIVLSGCATQAQKPTVYSKNTFAIGKIYFKCIKANLNPSHKNEEMVVTIDYAISQCQSSEAMLALSLMKDAKNKDPNAGLSAARMVGRFLGTYALTKNQ